MTAIILKDTKKLIKSGFTNFSNDVDFDPDTCDIISVSPEKVPGDAIFGTVYYWDAGTETFVTSLP